MTFTKRLHAITDSHWFIAPLALVLAIIVWTAIVYDRRAPFEYVSTLIEPVPAVEGQRVTVYRNVIWNRKCDGQIYREILKPGGIVAHYDRTYRPFPSLLGPQSAVSSFRLPPAMVPLGDFGAEAIYRGRVMFRDCGLTSWLMPIEVPFQEVEFTVVRAP